MVEKEFKCFICGSTFFSLHGDFYNLIRSDDGFRPTYAWRSV